MKRFIGSLPLLLFTFWSTFALSDPTKDFQSGNTFYKAKNYDAAIASYMRCMSAGFTSAELEYNLGNAFYKAGRNAEAIVHYERALRMSPGDEDIRYNLRIAGLKNSDRIEAIPQVFYQRWFEQVSRMMNERSWSIVLVFFIAFTAGSITVYFLTRSSTWKKATFFGSVFLVIAVALLWIIASNSAEAEYGKDRAVVMNTSVYVKSSPDEKGNDLFILHDGTTVQVLDELEGWKKIRIANGSSGWLPSSSIEII